MCTNVVPSWFKSAYLTLNFEQHHELRNLPGKCIALDLLGERASINGVERAENTLPRSGRTLPFGKYENRFSGPEGAMWIGNMFSIHLVKVSQSFGWMFRRSPVGG
jgi:hypothetical protein